MDAWRIKFMQILGNTKENKSKGKSLVQMKFTLLIACFSRNVNVKLPPKSDLTWLRSTEI